MITFMDDTQLTIRLTQEMLRAVELLRLKLEQKSKIPVSRSSMIRHLIASGIAVARRRK